MENKLGSPVFECVQQVIQYKQRIGGRGRGGKGIRCINRRAAVGGAAGPVHIHSCRSDRTDDDIPGQVRKDRSGGHARTEEGGGETLEEEKCGEGSKCPES